MTHIEKKLSEQLVSKGVSKKLAFMIETLDEEMRRKGKRIGLKENELCIYENGKVIARIGDVNAQQAFVYDSKLFIDEKKEAIYVFTAIFLESYLELMAAFVPIIDCENQASRVLLPEFHSFKISFDCKGDIYDIALLNDKTGVVAFVSRVDAEA